MMLLLIVLFFFTGRCSASPHENFLLSHGYTKIPLVQKRGGLYAQGSVGKRSVYFLIDTGSTGASILRAGVDELGLAVEKSDQKVANMSGQVSYAQKAIVQQVKVGAVEVESFAVKLMDQPFKHELPTIILGTEFLALYHAIIDIGQSVMYLCTKRLQRKDQHGFEQALSAVGFQRVPLTGLISGHYLIPVQVDELQPTYFLCDTGTSETTIAYTYAQKHKLVTCDNLKTEAATDGTFTHAPLMVKKLLFNPLQLFFQKPIMLYDETVTVAKIDGLAGFLGVVGVVGRAELSRLHALIDLRGQAIWLKGGENENNVFRCSG